MTDQGTPEERQLFDAACTGRLNSESHRQLEDLLRTSPAARRHYLDYAALHADLFGAVRVARVHDRLVGVLDDEHQELRGRHTLPPTRTIVVTAVLALATAAAVLLMLSPRSSEIAKTSPDNEREIPISAEEQPSDEFAQWPGLVARISRVDAVEWTQGTRVFAESDLVTAGTSVSLASGRVEIEFRQGAVVVLEGPAHLIAENANAASLLRGKLAAVAPPWATGFRVDTPGVDVVDHGTEFAMNVTGEGSDAQVNVVVTEGEVEVLANQQLEGGRRLRAGEGVQSSDGKVEVGDDAAARQLTKHLPNRPEFKNAVVVGDRWADWTVGVEGEPCRQGSWRYYTNGSQEFGNPESYEELVWDPPAKCYRPVEKAASSWLNKYVRVHRDGGHTGKGREQVWDKIDRYSIAGFVVPEDGTYRVEAGWLERRWARRWNLDEVLDIAVHVNDGPSVMRELCDRTGFVSFRTALGQLTAGDTIYVGVGPNGTDFNDKFRWGFYIVRETGQPDEDTPLRESDLALTD